jgi:bifunctional non-homologous end joining protein LigD
VGLKVYREKRKFDVTPEPRGARARGKGNRFVIQKHAARRLHYDLRLELDGVMKSWAVTRGPSLDPNEKRLAVEVEDHPVEYNSFEGTIPQGQYGGGTVLIWDRGTWHPEYDPHKGLQKGHLEFALDGEKLTGRWHLVRMHGRRGETKTPWLLIKGKDEVARGPRDPDILEEAPNSVVSGRSIPEIAAGKGRQRVWHSNRSVQENVSAGATRGMRVPPARASARGPRRKSAAGKSESRSKKQRKGKKKSKAGGAPLPDFVPPSLATLRAQPPADAAWVHEIKFDGYRIQARLDHGEVRLLTRKGLDWADKFPNVAEAVAALPAATALIDGEIVVQDYRGISSFSGLQAALKAGARDSFIYYVFDLLHLDGRNLSALPLVERKRQLRKLVAGTDETIRYSEHFNSEGSLVLEEARKMGLEGIVSKRKDAPYYSGRSDAFAKIKTADAQEFVVGGYTPSTAMPHAIGALVVGYYERGRLVYAGRMGTGYTHQTARDLWKRLRAIEVGKPPFDEIPAVERRRRDIVWVAPKMVVEAEFRGWTADRLLRQAAFKGVREDKPAREVGRELARDTDDDAAAGAAVSRDQGTRIAAEASKVMARKSNPAAKARARPTRGGQSANRHRRSSPRKPGPGGAGSGHGTLSPGLRGDGREGAAVRQGPGNGGVRFTHPDRIYWADVGVTKQDLADYYRSAWTWMAPHVAGRPLAFLRCPDGTAGECFFQKHASAGLTEEHLRTVIDRKRRQIITFDDLEGLLSLVQAGVLEIHVRGSKIESLDVCDRIVFDLDPGEGVAWSDLVAAARDVRGRLAGVKLESFVKLSGGKGLHVVLPIAGADWDTAKTFAQAVAMAMAADDPKRYVPKMTKSLRGGKIFVDYFRNSLEQTSVAAYSTRARASAPVSVPLTWEELGRTRSANQYGVLNLSRRLGSLKDDPWRDMPRVKQKLPDVSARRKR